jgi:hypothetical protein
MNRFTNLPKGGFKVSNLREQIQRNLGLYYMEQRRVDTERGKHYEDNIEAVLDYSTDQVMTLIQSHTENEVVKARIDELELIVKKQDLRKNSFVIEYTYFKDRLNKLQSEEKAE